MKKQGFSKFIAAFLSICLVASQASLPPVSVSAAEPGGGTGTTYYVDATGGNDANAGTSEAAAFQTLARVNAVDLEPGDSVLLKRGEVWHGEELKLTEEDSGEEGNVVTVSSYGEGSKPVISADGIDHAIFIYNGSYLLVENIEITNFVPEGQEAPVPTHDLHLRDEYGDGRSGIEIYNDTGFIANNIHIVNIDAHDIMGSNDPNKYWFQGAIFFMGGDNTTSSFDDILIEGCHLWDNKCIDITSGIDYDTRPYTNVVVRNNVSERNGKGSVVLAGCYKPLIEHNSSYDLGLGWTNYGWVVPIWEYNCEDAVFQYNESARCNANPSAAYGQNDAQGFDADIATKGRVTFQYNYSHDNAGGFMLVMPANEYMTEFEGFTIRYNLSVNDGRNNLGEDMVRILASGTVGSQFYNNVIYDAYGRGITWGEVGEGDNKGTAYATGDILIQNNIFYSNTDEGDYQDGNDKMVFSDNLYYGNNANITYSADEANPLIADPLFAGPIPEVALDGMEACRAFKLSANSPCINVGTVIDDNGGRDFFGNALYAGKPDIGIHEYGSVRLEEPAYRYDPIMLNDIDPLTYNGIYSVKATDVGSGSFSRTAAVNISTNYVARIYSRGAGTYKITVKNAADNAVIATKTFTASGQYASREISFNSRGVTSVIFEVSGVGASGTAYFDNAFLGVQGGTNLLSDPDFEDEPGTWTYGAGFSHYMGSNIIICEEPVPPVPVEPEEPPVLPTTAEEINDEFNSTALGSQWEWTNPVSDKWGLTGSSLHIDGIGGDIQNHDASNVLLQYAPEGDFTIETKMTGFPTTNQWEQAGILLYVDDGNFIKLNRVNSGSTEPSLKFQFGYAYDGSWPVKDTSVADPSFSGGTATDTCYLKIVKTGASYSGYYKLEGEADWTFINTFDNIYYKSKGYKQIGLYCLGGTAIHVDFDYFHISDMDLEAEEPDQAPVELVLDAHTGNRALGITGETSWNTAGYPSIQVTTGSAITANFWLKGSGNVTLFVVDNSWNFGSPVAQQTFSATPEWTQCVVPVTGSAIGGELHVQFNTQQNANANMLIDDVFFGEEGSENLIPNPSFEDIINTSVFAWGYDGVAGSSDPEEQPDGAPDGPFWVFEVLLPHSGLKALTIKGDMLWSKTVAISSMEVLSNTDMKAGIWIKGSGYVIFSVMHTNWGLLDSVGISATEEWTYYSFPFNTGSVNETDGKVTIFPQINGGSVDIIVDDIFIGIDGGDNLLPNPGFEDGLTLAWDELGLGGILDVSTPSDVLWPKDGLKALVLTEKTQWKSPDLSGIEDYITVEFDIAGTGNFTTSFSSGGWGVYDDHTWTAEGDWSHVEYTFGKEIGSGINGVNFANGINSGANILIDNVFIGVKGGINLLTGDDTLFGFEDGLTGWIYGGSIYPPELYDMNDKMYVVGDKVIFTVKVPNTAGMSYGYSFVGDLPADASFNPANRAFSWTPTTAGAYTLTFAAHEVSGADSERSVTIYVVEPLEEAPPTPPAPPATGGDTGSTTGSTVTTAPEAPKTVLTASELRLAIASGKDYTVSVKDADGKLLYSWTFTGENLKKADQDALEDIKLGLEVHKLEDDAALQGLIPGVPGLVISFEHDGKLPAQASVRIYAGNLGLESGTRIYLYHYNPETGKLETLPYSSNYIVDEEGYITINILHCSDYVVLPKEAAAGTYTSLRNQISMAPKKLELFTGTGDYGRASIKVTLPPTLEFVKSLKDKTSSSASGAVTLTYKSNDTKVATVSSSGVVTAHGKGTAKITTTATLYSGKVKTYTTTVTVKNSSIKLTKSTSSMKLGSTYAFKASVAGYDADDIVWTTTEKGIVVIDKKTGEAVAKAKGTDYVMAAAGNRKVTVKVVVK